MLLPAGAAPEARLLLLGRALRAFTDGFVAILLPVYLLALGLGCGDDASTGDVTFLIQAEDTITEGLAAGDGDENITDGWSVSFDRYAVAIGEIQLNRPTAGSDSSIPTI